MRRHSVGCGTVRQTRSATQSTAKFFGCSHDAVIRVYDEAGNVIETHEHSGDFREAS
jgi:hypothetical protein